MEWRDYIRQDSLRHHRQDYYLAQIALEVRRVLKKNPNALKIDHFLLKFVLGETGTEKKAITEEDFERRVESSKAFWGAVAGPGGKIEYKVRTPPSQKSPLVKE